MWNYTDAAKQLNPQLLPSQRRVTLETNMLTSVEEAFSKILPVNIYFFRKRPFKQINGLQVDCDMGIEEAV